MLSDLNKQIKEKNNEIDKLTRTNAELKKKKEQLNTKINQVQNSSQVQIQKLMATIKMN